MPKIFCIHTVRNQIYDVDDQKGPNLLHFYIAEVISNQNIKCSECFDLSSDHSAVFITISKQMAIELKCHLSNSKTDWNLFKCFLTHQLEDNMPLKNDVQIMNAVEHCTTCIQNAAW